MTSDKNKVDFNLTEMLTNGYRGDDPEDVKNKCHMLCKEYLGGIWCEIPAEKITIKRIAGGFTNHLFYCGVSPDIKPIGDEPTEVAIRFYEKKILPQLHKVENERLTDVIIGVITSQNNLSPKIYGFFQNGEILKYYKNQQFQLELQKDPELVKKVAQKLANFHSLKVPIKKSSELIFDWMEDAYEKSRKLFPVDKWIEEYNCETLKNFDMKREINWIKSLGISANSPIVFTHFDFRGSNILVLDNDSIDSETNSRIIFCDYEYADYYNRGIDFSSIFAEWGRPLNEMFDLKEFPSESVLMPFINSYIEESAKIYGKNYQNDATNSVEHIIYETKVFMLVRLLYMSVMSCRMYVDSHKVKLFSDLKQLMAMSDANLKSYLALKNKLLEENNKF